MCYQETPEPIHQCRLTIEMPNVLVLDEPTNHLDLESIEALVDGLKTYPGTLILVSHDRWFVGRLATRIVEINSDGIRDYPGTYEEYVHACGDDHLDVDTVILKIKKEKQKKDSADTEVWARADVDRLHDRSRNADDLARPDGHGRAGAVNARCRMGVEPRYRPSRNFGGRYAAGNRRCRPFGLSGVRRNLI